jgi:prepilin-type N-terminal cleavage/methylation domain-containing protein
MQPNLKRATSGFTLVELMITVAIIGILAATATTLFTAQQLRSKRTEGMTNVEALAKLAKGYFGDIGAYPSVGGYWPAPPPDPKQTQWDAASAAAFGAIGFRVEGAVRYRYDLDAAGECPCLSGGCFSAFAYSDLEGDTAVGGVGYFHRDGAAIECPSDIAGWLAPLDAGGTPIYDSAAAYLPIGGFVGGPDDY